MNKMPYFIRNIFQKDKHHFTIEWHDGVSCDYRLSELQKRCPCANCVDEMTGKRIVDSEQVPGDLKAVSIVSVGRYALRIEYTSGCSMGIYTFDMLREELC